MAKEDAGEYKVGDLVVYPKGDDLYYTITAIVPGKKGPLYTLEDSGGIVLPLDIPASMFKPMPRIPKAERECPITKHDFVTLTGDDDIEYIYCTRCKNIWFSLLGEDWTVLTSVEPEEEMRLADEIRKIRRKHD